MMRPLDHIVSDCLRGKPTAQRELYDRYASLLLGICFRYANGRDDAEEILQQSFIKIFTRMESFNNQGSFEGWMKRVTINTALNFLSSQKRLGFTEEVTPHTAFHNEDPEAEMIRSMEHEKLFECIGRLPDGYRVVLNLFAIEGLSHKEIGERLGITESTSRSQFVRAKSALKKILEESFNTDAIPYVGKVVRTSA
ncbi:MAG: sigma-70 family RNA polymerase sigma factor [Bacteroidetes bacterium]|jgi:RNA polymerase sigma factor (sigma-70 family)|nr:sigma-70 family RNA polymerase sigma factor [Bacteroidota bacterium]